MKEDKTFLDELNELSEACDQLGNSILRELRIYNFCEFISKGITKLEKTILAILKPKD